MIKKKINYDYAIIIPVCNEEFVIKNVIEELQEFIKNNNLKVLISVGINASNDGTEKVIKELDVVFSVTKKKGYGYGCQVAIDCVKSLINNKSISLLHGYIFFAGDGANIPSDIFKIIKIREPQIDNRNRIISNNDKIRFNNSIDFILGERTLNLKSWQIHGISRLIPNIVLGLFTTILSGNFYLDLGALRFIDKNLFDKLNLQEFVFGWTIEPQIKIARLQVRYKTFSYFERERLSGEQKISGVNYLASLKVGLEIAKAGMRVYKNKYPS